MFLLEDIIISHIWNEQSYFSTISTLYITLYLLCFHLSFHAMVSCAIHKNQVSIILNRNKNTFWYSIWKSDCSVKFKTFLELLTCILGNKPYFKWSSFSIENLAAQNLEEFKWHNTVYFLSAVLLLIANCNYWFRDFPQ